MASRRSTRRSTRRRRSMRGGANSGMPTEFAPAMGGGSSAWTRMVKRVYTQMKKKNKKATLGMAMKAASRKHRKHSK